MAQPACLIIDDEADIRELLMLTLERMGIQTECASCVTDALNMLKQGNYQLCLTDMRMPDGTGLEVVEHISKHYPGLPVAVITAHGSAENAVSALKAGAFDYITKPISLKQLRPLVESALGLSERGAQTSANTQEMIGESASIAQVKQMIGKLARSQAPVYISGESGTGKELAAKLIHTNSSRRDKGFIGVNCGAIPESLMESEFFGYKKGSFTGANADKEGLFQAANGGTLFFDEVADLPLAMQVKLLRAIQEKKVRMVGATAEESVDVRIISATHKNLNDLMAQGLFRQDLYYRLNVIQLKMPALRDRANDVPVLAEALLHKLCQSQGMIKPKLDAAAMRLLLTLPLPGNVRELENMLERALALCDGQTILAQDLMLDDIAPLETFEEKMAEEITAPAEIVTEKAAEKTMPVAAPTILSAPTSAPNQAENAEINLPDYLEEVERKAIIAALEKTNYNKTSAAKLLGVSFRTLRYRMSKLGLSKDEDADLEEET